MHLNPGGSLERDDISMLVDEIKALKSSLDATIILAAVIPVDGCIVASAQTL